MNSAILSADLSPAHALLAQSLDALALDSAPPAGAADRLMMALATERLAAPAKAFIPTPETFVLCLDRDSDAEAYSFEEALESARKPKIDLLAAGLEKPAKKKK